MAAENSRKFEVPIYNLDKARSYITPPSAQVPVYRSLGYIDGDGNCLFRALSMWIYGSQEGHNQLRKTILAYAKEHKAFTLTKLGETNFQTWIKKMEKDGSWGDSVVLDLVAKCYDVIILVVSYKMVENLVEHVEYFPDHRIKNAVQELTPVYFLININFHFELLTPI